MVKPSRKKKKETTPAEQEAPAPSPGPQRWRGLSRLILALALVVGLILGIIGSGQLARDYLHQERKEFVSTMDIDCPTPEKLTRQIFLQEVQRLGMRSEVSMSDPDLIPDLTASFSAHPWVESVEAITLTKPDKIKVSLRFRTPVMLVNLITDGKSVPRTVDAKGVLLPESEVSPLLPVLLHRFSPPKINPGQVWNDERIIIGARLAAKHRPKSLEQTPQGWRLRDTSGLVSFVPTD